MLIGTWTIDLTPENTTDNNVAMMEITSVGDNFMEGTFYREGVPIREGRTNSQVGVLYGALVSGDGTGDYNTTFYYERGLLHGTTHSLDRDFLVVWTATKNR